MSRDPQRTDDLDRYVAERDAREPGFAMLVENAEEKSTRAGRAGEQALSPDDPRAD